MHTESSLQAEIVLKCINQTSRHLFLTGKAGTGKTTLLRQIIATTHKNVVVAAPTGIAALHAKGVTLHSLFQLAPAAYIPVMDTQPAHDTFRIETLGSLAARYKMGSARLQLLRTMELLVIDEVSMLRADLLDAIDFVLKKARKNGQPFGGVQVLFIGDMLQLPPVVKQEEWMLLKEYYPDMFFFSARCLSKVDLMYVELKKVFRQKEKDFLHILENLRVNQVKEDDLLLLSRYVEPQFKLKDFPGYIYLTTHNYKADEINQRQLASIDTKSGTYHAEIQGEFPEKTYPMEPRLVLKVGAQVMFTKNDNGQEKRYYNGKIGQVSRLEEEEVFVTFPGENTTIQVDRYEWSNIRYKIHPATKEIEEEVIGTFVHYPIRLAWAITVHKSQGLTFDKAALDVAGVFAPGQAYVALSRLRSLDGLVLTAPLQLNGIQNSEAVMAFAKNETGESDAIAYIEKATPAYLSDQVKKAFTTRQLYSLWNTFHNTNQASQSFRSTYASWSLPFLEQLKECDQVSSAFFNWIDDWLKTSSVQIHILKDKTEGAYAYFFPVLKNIHEKLLIHILEVGKNRRDKEYNQELTRLEEVICSLILTIHKTRNLLRAASDGKALTKESVMDTFADQYRQEVVQKAKEASNLLFTEEVPGFRAGKKSKSTDHKKESTTQITYQLWKAGHDVEAISVKRMLTRSTIETHLAQLVEEGTIPPEVFFRPEEDRELTAVFEKRGGASLSACKEEVGDRYTYGQLKIFRSILNRRASEQDPGDTRL